jgi:CRP-like cAMP-binding protein
VRTPALGEAVSRLAWLPPRATSLVALARSPIAAAWAESRADPGAVLLVARTAAAARTLPSFFPALLHDPAILEAALRHLDDAVAPEVPVRELALLQGVPMFSPLRSFSLEQLASSLRPVTVPAGHEVFAQGDRGDRFYIVADGTVEIVIDGRLVQVAEAGDWFGEIALLRDVPRAATARARTDVDLRALDRDEFVGAVAGDPRSAEAADAVVTARLATSAPAVARY